MLKKRIIFTLHYDKGFFNLSRNFRLQKIGDLNWLLKNYNFLKIAESIDELIIFMFLEIIESTINFWRMYQKLLKIFLFQYV